ncbi:MAG: TetR/AcrR family transcriptional regulator [Lachnospiraceae bacterium]|nr:TetR/AcrR family transcriptional regulator [Lachnospiraceae bacterium]
MITGSEEESRRLMMNAAVKIIAAYGFEGFTTKKWAKEAGVAEGSLYYHFRSKNDLLSETFFYLDEMLEPYYVNIIAAAAGADGLDDEETAGRLAEQWRSYYHYLVQHPEYSIYYYRFRTSPRYTKEIREQQFRKLLKPGMIIYPAESVRKQNLLLTLMSDLVSAMAFRTVTGLYDDNESNLEFVRCLVLNGVKGAVSHFRMQADGRES